MDLSLRLLRGVAQGLSPAGGRAQLLILTYHRLLPGPDPLLPGEEDVARFRMHLEVLRDLFEVLPLSAAAAGLRSGSLPARAACITFDDGYASNAQLGLPLLEAFGMPATFFVATGFLDGGRMFNDTVIETVRRLDEAPDLEDFGLGQPDLTDDSARAALLVAILERVKYLEPAQRQDWCDRFAAQAGARLPDDLMMTSAEIQRLAAAGMEIGAHTVSHPILARVAPDIARSEIEASRRRLREMTGTQVQSFAYPNGRPGRDYTAEHVRIVAECGFEQAVSTAWGAARRSADRFQLPRISTWDRSAPRFALRLIRAYAHRDAPHVEMS